MTLADTITDEETGVKAEIHYDNDSEWANPRDNDNLGIMYCWHPNYRLGDEQFTRSDHGSIVDVFHHLVDECEAIEVMPLFIIDHSGISMSAGASLGTTEPSPEQVAARNRFVGDSAGWDTSWVGFIYTTEKRRAELGAPVDDIERQLDGEVKEYDTYLRGEVFTINVEDTDGETLESVGGFLGDDYAQEEAKSMLKSAVERHKREISERQFWLDREVLTV